MIPLLTFLAAVGILYFGVVETAFAVLMRLPQRLEAERERGDDTLQGYLEDPLRLFVPARIAKGVLLVLLVVLLELLVEHQPHPHVIAFFTGAFIAVAAGHVLPAMIVRKTPDRVLDIMLPTFHAAARTATPVTAVVIRWLGSPGATRSRLRPDDRHETPAAPHVEPAPADAADRAEARAHADERVLLRSVVDFGNTLVREVMTPRPDIVAIAADATVADLRRIVQEQEYSRLPVYAANLDNIVGLIVVKDLIQMPEPPAPDRKVSEFMRPASFVPETKRVADLLREFQQRRFQLAIVVDEYGGTAGLVTVEDVVEELVGEIRDEYDVEAEPIVRESDDTFVFSAKVSIEDLVDRLGVEIDRDGFETVGGYVLARVGRVPAAGERFTFDGLEVQVLEAERRRIHKVRIRRVRPEPEAAAG